MTAGRYRSAIKAAAKKLLADARRRKESASWLRSSARTHALEALDLSNSARAIEVLRFTAHPEALARQTEFDGIANADALEALASEAFAADVAAELDQRVRAGAVKLAPPPTEAEARKLLRKHFSSRAELAGAVERFRQQPEESQRLLRSLLGQTGDDARRIVILVQRGEHAEAAKVAGRHDASLKSCVIRTIDAGAEWPAVLTA